MIDEDPSRKHFFTDIINSVSRAKFSPIDGTVPMVANVPREYDTIKGAGPSDF